MSKHPDTIGQIDWEGKTYEIDWPFDLDDATTRDESFAVIYLNGAQVGEFCAMFEPLTSEEQVMTLAHEYITGGNTEDQS